MKGITNNKLIPITSTAITFVVFLIIIVNFVVFIYGHYISPAWFIFLKKFGCTPYEITHIVDLYPYINFPVHFTLLTSIFLHGSWFSMLLNGVFLGIFGRYLENKFGHISFLLFYLGTGIVSMLIISLLRFNSRIPFSGSYLVIILTVVCCIFLRLKERKTEQQDTFYEAKESAKMIKSGGSIISAILWMTVLSVLLSWLPLFGPLIAGFVGGKKAGGVGKGLLACIIPAIILGLLVTLVLWNFIPGVIAGIVGGAMIIYLCVHEFALICGALIGGALAK